MLNKDVESVNARYDDGSNDSLLHEAARKGYFNIANELLMNHADVNAKNKEGQTPLLVASLQASPLTGGQRRVIRELLNQHAEVNSQDEHGTTPLMAACCKGHYIIVKELLNHHADVNIQSKQGDSALIVASKLKRQLIVMELLHHNADVNLQNSKGNTALHSVLLENFSDTTINVVKLLLSDKTNSEKKNKKKKSVIQIAKESQNQEIIELIEDFFDKKKVEATQRELMKVQATQIINKKKRKLTGVSAVNDEVVCLKQRINQMEMRNTQLEAEFKKNLEEITTNRFSMKIKMEKEEFKSYKKLKQEYDYLNGFYEAGAFDKVIQPAKRECPICYNEMTPKEKIYQCQSKHFFCEDCFSKIRESTKKCPFCRVDIANNSIRCTTLEEVIAEEAN